MIPRIPRRSLLAMPALLPLAQARAAGNTVALVIGNGAYRAIDALPNPRRDAEAMGRLLEALGVQVDVALDIDQAGFLATLARFAQRSASAEVALVYYGGHGIQRRAQNWLVPVDATLQAAADAPRQLVSLEQVLQAASRAQRRAIILDACRNDPFASTSGDTTGLARPGPTAEDSLFAFSTSPGRVALDGTGEHSPFCDSLLDHLGTPGLDLRQVLTRVRRQVLIATNGQQLPWDDSSLTADVVLRAPGLPPVPRVAAPPPHAPVVAERPASRPAGSRPAPAAPRPAPAILRPEPVAPATTTGGPVAFDPNRYREIPRAYEHAQRAGLVLPAGLLVQTHTIDGRPTPLTGAYVPDSNFTSLMTILVAYDEQRGTATAVRTRFWRSRHEWGQGDGVMEGKVLRFTNATSLQSRWDLESGWVTALNNISNNPNNGATGPVTFRFRKID